MQAEGRSPEGKEVDVFKVVFAENGYVLMQTREKETEEGYAEAEARSMSQFGPQPRPFTVYTCAYVTFSELRQAVAEAAKVEAEIEEAPTDMGTGPAVSAERFEINCAGEAFVLRRYGRPKPKKKSDDVRVQDKEDRKDEFMEETVGKLMAMVPNAAPCTLYVFPSLQPMLDFLGQCDEERRVAQEA